MCHNLEWLDLTRTGVTTEGVEQLAMAPTAGKLHHLWLNGLRLVQRPALERIADACSLLVLLDVSWIREVDGTFLFLFFPPVVSLMKQISLPPPV